MTRLATGPACGGQLTLVGSVGASGQNLDNPLSGTNPLDKPAEGDAGYLRFALHAVFFLLCLCIINVQGGWGSEIFRNLAGQLRPRLVDKTGPLNGGKNPRVAYWLLFQNGQCAFR